MTLVAQRTVDRGVNPFAPIVRQANQRLTPTNSKNVYQPLNDRASAIHADHRIQGAIEKLRARMGKETFQQHHFGELILVPIHLVDVNVDIQREPELEHQAKIIPRFDPRIAMPIMVTRLKNGRYSAWEGQQTSCVFYHLLQAGLISPDTLIQVKAFDEDLEVPGSDLVGEAVGNYGFRQINGGMRKPIDAFHLHRSRVNGVRLYASQFEEDLQSEEIQQILERNSMFPAKASAAKYNQATPGMITYIHGLNLITGHGLDMKGFNAAKQDLDWALRWHDRYYPNEKGVDGGFILAFGRLHHAARVSDPAIVMDRVTEDDLYELFKARYGSPKAFHNDCKQRLKSFQQKNSLNDSWSDGCLAPILVTDYINWGGKCPLPSVPGMMIYANI